MIPIAKRYNTPRRRHVVKTRMTEEEYADFTARAVRGRYSLRLAVWRTGYQFVKSSVGKTIEIRKGNVIMNNRSTAHTSTGMTISRTMQNAYTCQEPKICFSG